MQKLVFATNNAHKVEEVQQILHGQFNVCSLADLNFRDDIPETSPTLEGNALQKARFVFQKFNVSCFADDTGLEVEALDGAPGVYSARYAGEEKNSLNNMKKVLSEMQNKTNRHARFRCVIALIINGEEHLFEGVVNGEILCEPAGTDGFGYDPIFRPDGFNCSFAQMPLDEKNKISHRGKAVEKLTEWLLNS